jgi:transposase-like protein
VVRAHGSYERKLETKPGSVTLKVPRLRSLPFETQVIERYRRRESSVEEALMNFAAVNNEMGEPAPGDECGDHLSRVDALG